MWIRLWIRLWVLHSLDLDQRLDTGMNLDPLLQGHCLGQSDIVPVICHQGVVDTGGKFATGINDTNGTDGNFTVGVVDTGGAP
jgi:hypothetical protein